MSAKPLSLFAALLLLAACGKNPDAGATATAKATASAAKAPATAMPTTATTASGAPTTAMTASAAPVPVPADSASAATSASAEPEPTGPVHIHLDTVKVTSGKSDTAVKTLKTQMLRLRTACVTPAIKKTPSFQGTLRVTLDVGEDGKIKASPTVVTGKLPDEIPPCVAKFYEEKVKLDPSKATIEATILLGPKVAADK